MAESKYEFEGIGKFNATLIFTAMAGGPLAFLTTGFLGTITFFLLKKFGSWLANQGLALLNVGIDFIKIEFEQKAFDDAMEKAIAKVKGSSHKLSKQEVKEIDDEIKRVFRRFASFV